MQIIPVLDLRHAQVVRGVKGERASYRPIETPLAPSADPVAVLAGLMRLAPFRSIYVADLDAIMEKKPDKATLARLSAAFPKVTFWVDGGIAGRADWQAAARLPGCRPVVGSETLTDLALLDEPGFREKGILSLDFRGDTFLGDESVLRDETLWPPHVLVMTLARVGSGLGPDLGRLSAIRQRAGPHRQVYAAGGVRDDADMAALTAAKIAGALVASALHEGRLTLDEFRGA